MAVKAPAGASMSVRAYNGPRGHRGCLRKLPGIWTGRTHLVRVAGASAGTERRKPVPRLRHRPEGGCGEIGHLAGDRIEAFTVPRFDDVDDVAVAPHQEGRGHDADPVEVRHGVRSNVGHRT